MHMYKTALAGFCLIIHICAQEVKVETKKPCEAGEGHDCESTRGVSALQFTRSTKKGDNLLQETDDAGDIKTKKGSRFHAMEAWQDLSKFELFDADAMAKGELTVSKEDWLQAFSKLDANKDGSVDSDDLADVESQCANKHWNATQEDYRLAVAMMAEYFPEFADFFIAHEPAIIFLAETNKSAPADAPLPSEESMELFQKNPKTLALAEWWGKKAKEVVSCAYALGDFVYNLVGWGLNMMGIYVMGIFDEAPPIHLFDTLIAEFKQWYIDKANEVWKAIKSADFWKAANTVWAVMKHTFSMGVIGDVIRAAQKQMSYWDWISTGVSMLANLIGQMSSAGAALVAKMLHQIVNAYNLVKKGQEAVKGCKGEA